MVNVNISLTKEAYDYLKMLKGKDKSFSEVVIEMKENGCARKGSKEAIMKFFGCLKDKDIDWEKRKKIMNEFREEFNERMNNTEKEMRKNDRI